MTNTDRMNATADPYLAAGPLDEAPALAPADPDTDGYLSELRVHPRTLSVNDVAILAELGLRASRARREDEADLAGARASIRRIEAALVVVVIAGAVLGIAALAAAFFGA